MSLLILAISFDKTISRPSTINNLSNPDACPLESLNKGFNILGHIKRVQTPSMNKMLSREHKIYVTENMMVKSMKEMNKVKSAYRNDYTSSTDNKSMLLY